jgi:diguanylate cyclase (GGDEF)-like protein
MLKPVGPMPRPRSRASGTAPLAALLEPGADIDMDVPLRLLQPNLRADVAIADLDDLLSAVKAKLRLTVADRLAQIPELRAVDAATTVQTSVLECVSALDQLHLTLSHELARRQQLELEVFETQTALAQTRSQLAGTQAGERRARHLAMHDDLTALPNRSYFRDQLDQALADADLKEQPIAVMYLDLDGFKAVNDAHGHHAGDEFLKIVAARLRRAVRAQDTVSRLGGDEFGCLLTGMPSRDHLGTLAFKLLLAVSAPFKIGTLTLSVRPSIGIATRSSDGESADLLLKHADAAMYRAKREHTGYSFFAEATLG